MCSVVSVTIDSWKTTEKDIATADVNASVESRILCATVSALKGALRSDGKFFSHLSTAKEFLSVQVTHHTNTVLFMDRISTAF